MPASTAVWACYDVYTNRVPEQDTESWPCKAPTPEQPFVPCCASGSICLSDNYCLGNLYDVEHYYIAGCTDPQFLDPSCSSHCKFDYSKTVAFDNGQWTCCDTRNLTGSNPANEGCALPEDAERWSSPSPNQLATVSSLPGTFPTSFLTGTPTFASTAVGNSTGSVATMTVSVVGGNSFGGNSSGNGSPSSSAGSSHGLSTGARVGIGVGIVLGLAFLFIILGFIILSRRRRKKNQEISADQKTNEIPGSAGRLEMAGDGACSLVELEVPAVEMPGNGLTAELPG
jgi:hypothetical protein